MFQQRNFGCHLVSARVPVFRKMDLNLVWCMFVKKEVLRVFFAAPKEYAHLGCQGDTRLLP